jgi:hypothetical protein
LLRHRLLPQPGGFEGFFGVEVAADPNRLAVLEVDHGGKRGCDLGSALPTTRDPASGRDDSIAEIPDVRELHPELTESLVQVTQHPADAGVSSVHRRITPHRPQDGGLPLHVRVELSQQRVDVAVVVRIREAFKALDVLPRHRPPSIPLSLFVPTGRCDSRRPELTRVQCQCAVPQDQDLFQLEFVTGGIQLPAWGTSPDETFVHICVLNVGNGPAVTRAFGLRTGAMGLTVADQVFDSDLDSDFQSVITGDIGPKEEWLYTWTLVGDGEQRGGYYKYWFRILATSPNLIPGIEIVSKDPEQPGVPFLKNFGVVARYTAGDFAVFHRRIRIIPEPGPVGPITSK